MKRAIITTVGIMAVIVAFLFAVQSGKRAAATGSSSSAPVTVTKTLTKTVTATPSPSPSPTSSSAAATPVAAPVAPNLAGALDVQFPAGDPGVISVVAQGPRPGGSYGTTWPVVIRNNTSAPVCDIRGTITATSGSTLVNSNSLYTINPVVVPVGGIAFASAYFDSQLPEDATVAFTFTNEEIGHCSSSTSATVTEVNLISGNLVGKVKTTANRFSVGVHFLCMDGNGQPVRVDLGTVDQDKLEAGQEGTFSVDTYTDTCDKYLVTAN